MRLLYRLRLLGFALFSLAGVLLAVAYLLSLLIPPLAAWYDPIVPVLAVSLLVALPTLLLPAGPPEPADLPPAPDPPLPGPAARAGQAGALLRLYLTQMLAVLNPFQLLQMVAQNGGQFIATLRRAPPAHVGDHVLQTRYRLPFAGEWYIYNGGVTPKTSHSWALVAQRYAYDFVITDAQLQRHRGVGDNLEDYFCYNQPIFAAADGTVVQVRDGIRDAPWVGSFWLDWLCRDFRGNFVVIQHAAGEYSVSAHLIPGSIAVQAGERVQQGQEIGRCGNSGHSTEPHLHFQLQDHPHFWLGIGLPLAFVGVTATDAEAETRRYLTRGMYAQNREEDTEQKLQMLEKGSEQ
jgi:murein DD-endopeptidase MepM/ murein hydrolase activator NlpD